MTKKASIARTITILTLFFYDKNIYAFTSPRVHIGHGIGNKLPTTRTFYTNDPDEDTANSNNKPNKKNIMRAWNCHGRNQRDLVDRMMQAKIVRSDSVRDVLSQVDRQHYAPPQQSSPYLDSPQPIGLGQTISAPHMHAHVLEEIYPFLKASKANHVKILSLIHI